MKYCQYCGTPLVDDAMFCSNCGKAIIQPTQQTAQKNDVDRSLDNPKKLVETLSSRLKINGIIWVIIASIQIIICLAGGWVLLIVGVLNIVSAITDIKNSKRVLTNQNGIVKAYEPLANAIIALVYNLVIGGVIGVLGSIYYLIFVRGFVMENKIQFLSMECGEPIPSNNTKPQNEKDIYIGIILTEQEASKGVLKEVFVDELQKPLKLNVPKNIKDGDCLKLHNVKVVSPNGITIKKDIYIKINIKRATSQQPL